MTDEQEMDLPEDAGLPEDDDQGMAAGDSEAADAAMSADDALSEDAGADEIAVAQADDESDDAGAEPPGLDQLADELSQSELDSLGVGGADADDSFKVVNEDDIAEDDAEAAMLAMLDGLPDEADKASPEDINFGSASVSDAEFAQLQQPAGKSGTQNIELLMDVDLPVSIELGRTRMSIQDILALGPGSVVELNKLAGEPVDLLVNFKVVARGEVVVVDENFGLRVTQLMTPEERLKALAEE